jgi:hypothetical protein
MGYLIPMVRAIMMSHVVMVAIPSVLWIGSIYVEEPMRLILVWLAIFIGRLAHPKYCYGIQADM